MAAILSSKAGDYIKFPTIADDIAKVKQGFGAQFGFPNVLGVIDGTHIMIQAPSDKDLEPLYVCRKNGHSINVQIICNHESLITDLVAKWPGATHDSFMWQNCGLRKKFEATPPNGWLIGKTISIQVKYQVVILNYLNNANNFDQVILAMDWSRG
jgi:hypothetical protein